MSISNNFQYFFLVSLLAVGACGDANDLQDSDALSSWTSGTRITLAHQGRYIRAASEGTSRVNLRLAQNEDCTEVVSNKRYQDLRDREVPSLIVSVQCPRGDEILSTDGDRVTCTGSLNQISDRNLFKITVFRGTKGRDFAQLESIKHPGKYFQMSGTSEGSRIVLRRGGDANQYDYQNAFTTTTGNTSDDRNNPARVRWFYYFGNGAQKAQEGEWAYIGKSNSEIRPYGNPETSRHEFKLFEQVRCNDPPPEPEPQPDPDPEPNPDPNPDPLPELSDDPDFRYGKSVGQTPLAEEVFRVICDGSCSQGVYGLQAANGKYLKIKNGKLILSSRATRISVSTQPGAPTQIQIKSLEGDYIGFENGSPTISNRFESETHTFTYQIR